MRVPGTRSVDQPLFVAAPPPQGQAPVVFLVSTPSGPHRTHTSAAQASNKDKARHCSLPDYLLTITKLGGAKVRDRVFRVSAERLSETRRMQKMTGVADLWDKGFNEARHTTGNTLQLKRG